MTQDVAITDDVAGCCALATLGPNEGSGENELPRNLCEPMGVAEVATYLGVKPGTVYQWLFRSKAGALPQPLPPEDWVVNEQPAWNKPTIIGWAVATERLDPAKIRELDDTWEKAKADGKVVTRRAVGTNRGGARKKAAPEEKPAAKSRKRAAT